MPALTKLRKLVLGPSRDELYAELIDIHHQRNARIKELEMALIRVAKMCEHKDTLNACNLVICDAHQILQDGGE